jgi:hypothetical protein
MNVNFATLDPYAIDNSGSRINIYINNGGSLFRMTSANLTMNYSISSRKRQKQKDTNEQSQRNGGRDDDLFGANTILNDNRRSQFDGAEEGGEDFRVF